jgi:mRNA interferase MazF
VWVDLPRSHTSEPANRRPAIVLQHDRFNRSRIATTVVAAITSNLNLSVVPGKVRLRKGEAGLPRPSVVNVTQIATVDRSRLLSKLGRVSRERLREVWDGVRLVLEPSPE